MTKNDKTHIDAPLVHRLVAAQFPQWAEFQVKPVEFGGWDNRTFHLGENMLVRLPSAAEYAFQVEKEQRWLLKLAPHLPLPIPIPLALGKPAEGYPWHWSIYRWLPGHTAAMERIANLRQFAIALGKFLVALQQCDTKDGPIAGPHNFYRGGPLATYDDETRQAIARLGDKIDTKAVTAIWDKALDSTWKAAPVWVHGDIAMGNLLVENGQLNAVIDFGSMGVGDPACDLVIAWTFFQDESRDAFRATLPYDRATWARARGWALWKALIVYAGLPGTDSKEIAKSKRVLGEILSDEGIF